MGVMDRASISASDGERDSPARQEARKVATMARRTNLLADEVYGYLLRCSSREPEVLARLREATDSLPESMMQVGPDQGQLMAAKPQDPAPLQGGVDVADTVPMLMLSK